MLQYKKGHRRESRTPDSGSHWTTHQNDAVTGRLLLSLLGDGFSPKEWGEGCDWQSRCKTSVLKSHYFPFTPSIYYYSILLVYLCFSPHRKWQECLIRLLSSCSCPLCTYCLLVFPEHTSLYIPALSIGAWLPTTRCPKLNLPIEIFISIHANSILCTNPFLSYTT